MFKSGVSITNTAKRLGVSRQRAREVLVSEELYIPRKTIGDKEKRQFVELYHKGYTTKEISLKTDFNCNTINRHLREADCPVRRYDKRVNVPLDSAFSSLTPEAVYWGGFIAGDGCVFSRRVDGVPNTMTIALAEYDLPHLHKLKEFLEHSGKLTYNDNTKSYAMTVSSKQIVSDLEKHYNITPDKTYSYSPPVLPNNLIPYFVLGLLDADGGITYTSNDRENRKEHNERIYVVYFDGTHEACKFIQDFFETNVKISPNLTDEGDIGSYRYSLQGNVQLYNKLSKLFPSEEAKSLCLQRKYQRYLMLKEQTELVYS